MKYLQVWLNNGHSLQVDADDEAELTAAQRDLAQTGEDSIITVTMVWGAVARISVSSIFGLSVSTPETRMNEEIFRERLDTEYKDGRRARGIFDSDED